MPDAAGQLIASGTLQHCIFDVKCLNLNKSDYFRLGKCGSILFTNGGFGCRLPIILFLFILCLLLYDLFNFL